MQTPAFILADNQAITHAGLQRYLQQLYVSPVVFSYDTKRRLIQGLEQSPHAIVVIDYALFDFQSIEELLIVAARYPSSQWILFSNELSESLMKRVNGEPQVSLLLKECEAYEIHAAMRSAVSGTPYLCQSIRNLLQQVSQLEPDSPLTQTETEILKLIAKGKTVKEIAAIRHSSTHTITTHKKNLFRKIHVNNVFEATRYALKAGLVEMMEYYI